MDRAAVAIILVLFACFAAALAAFVRQTRLSVAARLAYEARERARALELQEAHQRARALLEVCSHGSKVRVFEYELPDGTMGTARQTMSNVWESLGNNRADAPGDFNVTATLLVHPDDLPRLHQEIELYLEGARKDFEVEFRVRHADGRIVWGLARGVALRDTSGKPTRLIGIFVDITDIKRIEGDLQRAREAAEAANRAKDEFLANVSHEIRTPMNAILGMAELAMDSAQTDHQRQLLATVNSAAKNLLGIVNDLLDFSKIAAGKVTLDRADFSLRGEVGDTLRALAARAQRKGLEIECRVHPEVPESLFGDAGRLRQVLMNLVGNAIKFTDQGTIAVEVSAPTPDRSEPTVPVVFRIRDTGIGIARDKQATIFEAFEQEDASTTRKYGGTGLGLTISAQLAALMNGDISVRSEPGKGSTFEFKARFSRSTHRALEAFDGEPVRGPTGRVGGEPLRVLVAEDNELNVAVLRELLSQGGHRVHFVGDGRGALSLATGGQFDVMLLDLHMPEMDGFEVVQAVRERELRTHGHLPVIALTARSSERDRERSLAAGMDEFLAKPIDAATLSAALERVVAVVAPPKDGDVGLLDQGAILRACGGSAAVCKALCEVFRRAVPEQMAFMSSALDDGDLPRLGEGAHKMCGTLGAFSTIAATLARTVHDAAMREDVGSCTELVRRLELMCTELLEGTRSLTFDALQT